MFERVLFLDIDGVLNSPGFFSQNPNVNPSTDLDPKCLAFLHDIERRGVDIVVSSTWRTWYSRIDLSKILGVRVKDKTPDLYNTSRGIEIQTWIDENNPKKFCIIDDDDDMLIKHQPFFVKTSFDRGMTEADHKKIITILGVA